MRIIYLSNISNEFIFELTVTAGQSVTLPLIAGYTHDFTVIWGDGGANGKVTTYSDADATHTFTNSGTYTVRIRGKCQSFSTNNTAAIRTSITKVIRWGTAADFRLLNLYGCTNLTQIPYDGDGTTAITGAADITTFAHFLRGCTSYTQALNDRMFSLCPDVTSFESTFESSGVTGSIPELLFKYNTLTTVFKRTFYYAAGINGSIDADLFCYNTIAQSFEYTFAYTSISGNVPSLLFNYCNTNATNFKGTFSYTNLGNATEVLPDDIFDTNTNALTFEETFYATKYSCEIPLIFTQNTKVTTVAYCFGLTPFTGTIPVNLFDDMSTSVLDFSGTFYATNISGIPDHLFYTNTNALYFNSTFSTCYYLQASNNGLGYNPINNVLFSQNVNALQFGQTFWEDYNITVTLPEDMFWNTKKVTNIWGCFARVDFRNIPEKLLWNMPDLTSVAYFMYMGGWHIAYPNCAIPRDFFYYNTKITDFSWCFRWRSITEIPDGLFRNNFLATTFYRCFDNTTYGTIINQYIFSEANDESAYERFSSINPDFYMCFYNSGLAGSFAPELWNPSKYDYGRVILQVYPSVAWVAGDIITGQSSGATCEIVLKGNNNNYIVKNLSGVYQDGEVIGPAYNLIDCNPGYPSFRMDGGTTLNINVSPSTDWVINDIVTGQSSGATCIVVAKITATSYSVRNVSGTFTDGEVIGVTGVSDKLADQDAGAPTFTRVNSHADCFHGATSGQYSNFADIPADWM
jgi:hypothetical protein